ncbi:polyprenyl synthetase family protein [Candidatus Saccharibacteria bacterium]|nr:polyprenyl synthetase family protein [Candidatus Saccharibacteria bacterium]
MLRPHSALLQHTTQAVDSYLTALIQQRIDEANTLHTSYKQFWENILSVTTSGGKRFRPYLTMVGYGSFSEDIVPVASAQELIHTAMLVHDDIIDQDMVRRGHKNMSGIYNDKYSPLLDEASARHHADSVAIIAGDALIAEAFFAVSSSSISPELIRKITTRLHASIFEVIGGEFMDVEAAFVKDMSYEPLIVSRYKTAGYGFIGPLLTGAYCANASEKDCTALEAYGGAIGIAFQLQDDLLGVFGDENETGKSTLGDLREAKATKLIEIHKTKMNEKQAAHFNAVFGNQQASDSDLHSLKADLIASGARKEVETLCETYYKKALSALPELSSSTQQAELLGLTNILMARSS